MNKVKYSIVQNVWNEEREVQEYKEVFSDSRTIFAVVVLSNSIDI